MTFSLHADTIRYLEEDPNTTVLERRRELTGYELYIVEQWACSRVHPTFVITTYTGLPQHKVLVSVLSLPTNEDVWSPRLRVYLKAISEFHARKKETPLGTLMVTNLSSFPSALTVIAVPGGDVRSHREDFIVNENLKRLGCSGRAGMTLSAPTASTQAKFMQQYRTSDRLPIAQATTELVKLCQIALMLSTKLASEYADGLLCDVTERAVNDWWTEIGIEYYNVEPSDGILGPTTVAALLGMLIGARNRLSAYGAPIAKDVFDLKATKRGIAYFQKSQKLPRSRRLDRQTLDRLHRVTSKAANGEGWIVPKAVKSTVAELSGKGGDMVMGMVGGRDKTGIADVESLDIDTFVRFAIGESCKWLWHGKSRKSNTNDLLHQMNTEDDLIFSGDEHGGYIWASRKRNSMADEERVPQPHVEQLYTHTDHGSQFSLDASEKDQALRKAVFKSVTGKMSEAKSGLGRISNVVGISGLRGHNYRHSKDSEAPFDPREAHPQDLQGKEEIGIGSSTSPSSSAARQGTGTSSPKSSFNQVQYAAQALPMTTPRADSLSDHDITMDTTSHNNGVEEILGFRSGKKSRQDSKTQAQLAETKSSCENITADRTTPLFRSASSTAFPLRNARSLPSLPDLREKDQNTRLPRHLSFSIVDSVFSNDTVMSKNEIPCESTVNLALEHFLTQQVSILMSEVSVLMDQEANWVGRQVRDIEELDRRATVHQKDLDSIQYGKFEEYHILHDEAVTLLDEEFLTIIHEIKDVEVLGAKLEYELSALLSKIEDVEDGIADFTRQISDLEARTQELIGEGVREEPWFRRVYNFMERWRA